MRVRVDELPETGRVIHFHESPAWFSSRLSSAEDAREIALARAVDADLELKREKDQVELRGHLRTAVRLACSRCLEDFVLELDEEFEVSLLRPLAVGAPEEIDLRAQDLDSEFYDGTVVDVDLIVSEQIFLALPQRPLCLAQCRGLCPGCGADLNHEACRCHGVKTESAFAVLRSIEIKH